MRFLILLCIGYTGGHMFAVTFASDLGPKFVMDRLQNVTVMEGADARLSCYVEPPNFGGHKLAWLHNSERRIVTIGPHVIAKSSRVSVVTNLEEGSSTLLIQNVVMSDGGHYMCQLTTDPPTQQLVHLSVTKKPAKGEVAVPSFVTNNTLSGGSTSGGGWGGVFHILRETPKVNKTSNRATSIKSTKQVTDSASLSGGENGPELTSIVHNGGSISRHRLFDKQIFMHLFTLVAIGHLRTVL